MYQITMIPASVTDKKNVYVCDIERVFTSYYSVLCYFAFRYVQDDEAARDIVQDVFVRLMEKKQIFQHETHLKNFLYLAVKNSCLNYMRGSLSREHYMEYLKQEENGDEFECRILELEIYQKLNQAIALLPPECRKVFELCYFEGKSNEAVAQILDISIHTVKAQKKRGKQILKKNLQGLFPLLFFLLDL